MSYEQQTAVSSNLVIFVSSNHCRVIPGASLEYDCHVAISRHYQRGFHSARAPVKSHVFHLHIFFGRGKRFT